MYSKLFQENPEPKKKSMGMTHKKEKTGTPMVNVRPGQASRAVNGAITKKFEAPVFVVATVLLSRPPP